MPPLEWYPGRTLNPGPPERSPPPPPTRCPPPDLAPPPPPPACPPPPLKPPPNPPPPPCGAAHVMGLSATDVMPTIKLIICLIFISYPRSRVLRSHCASVGFCGVT